MTVEQIEEMGIELVGQAQTYLTSAIDTVTSTDIVHNIEMIEDQFSVEQLFEQAKKAGLDLEDLMEYGFDMKCTG